MPEGPEIKLTVESTRAIVNNKLVIQAVCDKNGRYANDYPIGFNEFNKTLSDQNVKIDSVNCRGKFIYWGFSNNFYLLNTMGMTGQWGSNQGKHPCMHFDFHDQSNIYFNDPRHFGTIKFVEGKDQLNAKLAELGWDPLQDDLTKYSPWLIGELAKTAKPIGQVLMDQSLFAGVGNYIRAEALYLAKMSPWKPANQLSKNDAENLFQACIDVMQTSYQYQGATIQTYKTAYGEEGRYSSCFKVYGKKTDPLGNKITKEDTPDKRTIHWCPDVQK